LTLDPTSVSIDPRVPGSSLILATIWTNFLSGEKWYGKMTLLWRGSPFNPGDNSADFT